MHECSVENFPADWTMQCIQSLGRLYVIGTHVAVIVDEVEQLGEQ